MTQKKAPALTGASKTNKVSNKTRKTIIYPDKLCKVEFFPDGVALTAPHKGNPKGKGIPEGRGKVSGWSPSSRRRMREFMLTKCIRDDYQGYSVTLTIPGPLTTGEESKKLFNRFSTKLHRMKGCGVWRMEVQQRGEIHWHAVIGLPPIYKPYEDFTDLTNEEILMCVTWNRSHKPREHQKLSRLGMITGSWYGCAQIQQAWFSALQMLGPVSTDYHGETVNPPTTRDRLTGAQKFSAKVEPLPEIYGAWKRYLFDHTTKLKQEQIAENRGRHWGKIGKSHFRDIVPTVETLTHVEYSRVLRWFNRLVTPYVKDNTAMFCRRRGRSWSRGKSGRYIAFSNPETLRRMVECATGEILPVDQRK